MVWYTDGFLIEGSAEAGIYCEDLAVELSVPLGINFSIFLAKVRAILECAHGNRERNKSNDCIFICKDIQGALKPLSSFKSLQP